ncbi:MAG: hypothetical protein IKD18_04770 [Clostridia bacterium]|nr:hypothetical protein [Clostridia bacterium]
MIEGTAHARAVGVVFALILTVVNEKALTVGVKGAGGEYVVAAVVDTAVNIMGADDARKLIVFAETGNKNTRAASVNAAIRSAKGAVAAVARIPQVEPTP